MPSLSRKLSAIARPPSECKVRDQAFLLQAIESADSSSVFIVKNDRKAKVFARTLLSVLVYALILRTFRKVPDCCIPPHCLTRSSSGFSPPFQRIQRGRPSRFLRLIPKTQRGRPPSLQGRNGRPRHIPSASFPHAPSVSQAHTECGRIPTSRSPLQCLPALRGAARSGCPRLRSTDA